ncbi:helix-turn-helix domain-containing protein [Actinomadura rupiterrae]|uniref:helix-turn-helix domain-containing protein n=1 Tax=Actinomadura rupiterrae TaxID=559627 RepID=UPI0020A2D8BA|nr:helix-turn-helix transcriptional regulator [Actinomadura rupiterrae]MCP2337557.1 transcriptional regulator with XRE-family HTH domain [Actinomadura rupiterrae]
MEFWFAPEIAAALEVWDWQKVLRAVWKATGMTQEALAQQTGIHQGSISRLMAGKSGGQRIETAVSILDGLGIPRILAGLAPQGLHHLARNASVSPGAFDDLLAPETPRREPVKRREFGSAVLLVGLSASLPAGTSGQPRGVQDVLTSLKRPSDIAADLYAMDDRFGGASLVEIARARLASLREQMKRVTLPPERERMAVSVAGELEVCAGWFSHEAGKYREAAEHYSRALYASHEAGNEAVRLHALNLMAMLAMAEPDPGKQGPGPTPDKALQIAGTALDTAPDADPRLRSLLAMRQALAAARIDDPKDFERFLGQAWDELDVNRAREDEPWFAFFSVRELRGLEAIGRSYLGQHDRTVEILTGAIPGMLPRNAAYYSLDLARSLVLADEVDAGVDTFHRVLPSLIEVSSIRVRKRIGEFALTLSPHARRSEDVAETRRVALKVAGNTTLAGRTS